MTKKYIPKRLVSKHYAFQRGEKALKSILRINEAIFNGTPQLKGLVVLGREPTYIYSTEGTLIERRDLSMYLSGKNRGRDYFAAFSIAGGDLLVIERTKAQLESLALNPLEETDAATILKERNKVLDGLG